MLASLETSGVPLIERRYSRGEHAYMRGDPDEGLWFLLEGTMELYKLEEAYFVVDGHHRVSVARYHDVPTVEAAVVEFHPKLPAAPAPTISNSE